MSHDTRPRPASRSMPHDQADAVPDQLLQLLLAEHQRQTLPRLARLWSYYRNPMTGGSAAPAHQAGDKGGFPYRLAQEQGLPARLTRSLTAPGHSQPRRERVIENDIAWRIHALVDFMFGQPVAIQSLATESELAEQINQLLRAVFEANGGIGFFQDMALLGSVYGFVDVMLRLPENITISHRHGERHSPDESRLLEAASMIGLELIEGPRVVPLMNPSDYRVLDAYILNYHQQTHELERHNFLDRVRQHVAQHWLGDVRGEQGMRRAVVEQTQVWTSQTMRHYVGRRSASGWHRRRVAEQVNPLGILPVVHIQNLSQPFAYEGLSEVEPLIPLQDELNTRLSDRANRVTFQCFKMYLGKGIEDFIERPVGPGQMWATDNPQASIETFGGDAANPSETAHIDEIRQAMDKTSAVTPLAAGMLRDKVGNLTSENALRVVMMGLLTRTTKKRISYGHGIERLCEMILHAANVMGILHTQPHQRRVRLDWPNPMIENDQQRLQSARMKLDIGVPRHQVLAELGYQDCPEKGEDGVNDEC